MIIRTAQKSDFDRIGKVFAEENQYHTVLLPDRFQIARPIMTQAWFDEILKNPYKTLLTADLEGEIVGVVLIAIRTSPDDPIFQPRRYGYIDELAVLESYRGRGIGRALMEAVHEWVLAQGLDEVELNVWEINQPAMAFYKRLGYCTIRRTMKVSLRDQSQGDVQVSGRAGVDADAPLDPDLVAGCEGS